MINVVAVVAFYVGVDDRHHFTALYEGGEGGGEDSAGGESTG